MANQILGGALERLQEHVDTIVAIRTLFILQTASVLFFHGLPFLNQYLSYGARTAHGDTAKRSAALVVEQHPKSGVMSAVMNLIDYVIMYPVPHAFFVHFYAVSVLSSLFWGWQILTKGIALNALSQTVHDSGSDQIMSREQISLVWCLMAVQGVRRLYESMTMLKNPSSTMSAAHYGVGIFYYLTVGVAIWIEGSKTILSTSTIFDFFHFTAPSIRTMIFLPLFLVASGVQNDCHRYLASLPKYTLPEHPIFVEIVCPHYTAECLIYLSLAFMAAPRGTLVNQTIFTALLFCATNLGATADATKRWYEEKFGAEKVSGRWRMIPKVW